MARSYDFVAIGGGSSGYNAARVAAAQGRKVAVIDGARKLGGLCILKGCMPSKALIYSAEVLHLARTGGDLGLRITGARAEMKAMQSRKRRIIADFANHRLSQLESGDFELIRSHAKFRDSQTVVLNDGRLIKSSNFLIGTGSRVSFPPIPGLSDGRCWTSDDVLDLNFIPRSVIVLGGGIVACELAQFLKRIGTHVILVQRSPDLLKEHSKESSDVIKRAFKAEGIEIYTNTKITGIYFGKSRTSVVFSHKGKVVRRSADHLFNALGREPETAALNLSAAGVKTSPNGRILTNKWQQTTSPNIYAAGDCCGPHEIVHVAIQQAELAARHSANIRGLKPVAAAMLLGVVFTDPQVATIGWRRQDLDRKGISYIEASHPFGDHGKSIIMNAHFGHVTVLAASRSGRILGAEVVGRDAGELIHCFSIAMAMSATVQDMLRAPWYHPTLAEVLTYPLEELAEKTGARRSRRI